MDSINQPLINFLQTDISSQDFLDVFDDLDESFLVDHREEAEHEDDSETEEPKRKKTGGVPVALLSKEEQIEKREKNREHAKISRLRKKFLLDSLQRSVDVAESENRKLRQAIRTHLQADAEVLIAHCCDDSKISTQDLLTKHTHDSTIQQLDMPDYSLIKTLQSALQSFVITDPALPDNPIVYASYGFLELTGYSNDQVLGRNCRFLQGSGSDITVVNNISKHIAVGKEVTSVLLNYRADGTPFYNQVYVSPLKDPSGKVINFLGVQCKVSEEYARAFTATTTLDAKK